MRNFILMAALPLAAACGALQGNVNYTPPHVTGAVNSSKVVEEPRDKVWAAAVPRLGKEFFVINNIDKASGLINISYSGNPGNYADCGNITTSVKNLRGERTYNFAGSSPHERYEIVNNNALWTLDRTVSLEGRVNLIFEEVSPQRTRVTANTRYLLTRVAKVYNVTGGPAGSLGPDTISFTSGSSGTTRTNDFTLTCAATGQLEQELLNLIE